VGASEPRLPTAIGRLTHGNLMVVDVLGGVRSSHERNQPSLAHRAARTGRTARERRCYSVDSIEVASNEDS